MKTVKTNAFLKAAQSNSDRIKSQIEYKKQQMEQLNTEIEQLESQGTQIETLEQQQENLMQQVGQNDSNLDFEDATGSFMPTQQYDN
ncbi:hypothetical protein CMI47_18355 [Candidatus Pacearchaeota archaeon]|jgi:predicted  nucleic acid-binding Zn-ribbon protein|nr:hypothetical protein [Candidatus Pacearchaeota archaeon]|tara:strand:- start:4756 stop:5016 length:261 start_codon:yes stop_codon:yes gene_type:complete